MKVTFIAPLLAFALLGCASNPLIYSDDEVRQLIHNLNDTGEGEVTNCHFASFDSTLETRYSFASGRKTLVIAARDNKYIEAVNIKLEPEQARKLNNRLNYIAKADFNPVGANLALGYLQFGNERVSLSSRKPGEVHAVWQDAMHNVLTRTDASELWACIHQLSLNLDEI